MAKNGQRVHRVLLTVVLVVLHLVGKGAQLLTNKLLPCVRRFTAAGREPRETHMGGVDSTPNCSFFDAFGVLQQQAENKGRHGEC